MHIPELVSFLSELSENNNRAWFVMNKPRYDILRGEFLSLVGELIAAIARFDPAVQDCNPRKALFRIHRDMRFSSDKLPYKTNFSAAISASGLKKPSQGGGPVYYFHIAADGSLVLAAGEYLPPPDRLRAIRQQIAADGVGFRKLVRNRKLVGAFGELQQKDALTRPPKGFDRDLPEIEYIKLKSFVVRKASMLSAGKPTNLMPDDLKLALVSGFKHAYPLIAWLRQVT